MMKIIPINNNQNSFLLRMAIVPNAPPNASEPVSPINIFAGLKLKYKKPRQAPAIAALIIANPVYPLIWQRVANVAKEMKEQPEASPSSPSVKFIALDAPIITKIAKNG